MQIFKTKRELKQHLTLLKLKNETIGFVPTMGALHEGHLSLIEESKLFSTTTVCSIFVNPTQFNNLADFEKYPITIDNDIKLLKKNGCDILFLPEVNEIYPNGTVLQKKYNLGNIENVLDGKYRPGHFQGVCQIVEELLNIINPNNLFLGQKDFQQCMVIIKLLKLMKKETEIKIFICSTKREKNGLAMSSRNTRLSSISRETASIIFKILTETKATLQNGELTSLIELSKKKLLKAGFEKIDYISICKADDLKEINFWDGKENIVMLIAAFINDVRLIDNMVLN